MIKEEELAGFEEQLEFWKHLTPTQQEMILQNAKHLHFNKGQSLHRGESECVGVLLIQSGCIRTYITSEEGREITLFRSAAFDVSILSASCILKTIEFDVFMEAENDSEVIQISSPLFAFLSAENVYVELFSYKLATERFSDVMWAMQQILFQSFDKRLAAFLIERSGKAEGVSISMTHEQIARNLGTAREVVTRMLKYFVSEGFVTLQRGSIAIIDSDGLQKLIDK